MIALLLNSGRGTRMGAETKEHPKCMCRLDEQDTIISWQVKLLRRVGVKEAVVTTGPFADMLREHLESLDSGIIFHYVPNPDYMNTNYIVSMDNARALLEAEDLAVARGAGQGCQAVDGVCGYEEAAPVAQGLEVDVCAHLGPSPSRLRACSSAVASVRPESMRASSATRSSPSTRRRRVAGRPPSARSFSTM